MMKRLAVLQLSSFIMGAIAVISFVTVYSLVDSFNWINHTHDVIYQLHRIKDDITDCQTSVRETVFSEQKSFLSNYIAKSPGIESELDNLQWLTRDNETQQKNVYSLRQNVGRRLAGFRDQIDLFNDGKYEEARSLIKQKFGEAWIASTRNMIEIIESEELRLIDLRLRDYKQKSNIVLYGIPLLMILYIVVFNTTTRSIIDKMKLS